MRAIFCMLANILLISASKFHRNVTRPVNSDLVGAVHSVLDETFYHLFSTVNVVTCVSNPKDRYFQDLHSEILQHRDIFNETYIFRLDNKTHILGIRFRLKNQNVFLLDTFESFLKLNANLVSTLFNFRGNFLFVFTNGLIKEIQQMAQILYDKMILSTFAIYEEEGEVKILEFKRVRKDQCNVMITAQVDTFRDGNFINGTNMFSRGK